MLIPRTLKVTTWNERKIGDKVNLEVDQIARYVARLTEGSLNRCPSGGGEQHGISASPDHRSALL
jgi:riboflavin synthase alpha subunit